jgi:hypothetical protein
MAVEAAAVDDPTALGEATRLENPAATGVRRDTSNARRISARLSKTRAIFWRV